MSTDNNYSLKYENRDKSILSMDIVMENPLFYAELLSEGDKHLEAFLLKCFKNNIHTRACCAGNHYNKSYKKPFITFDNIEENADYLKTMMNHLYSFPQFIIAFGSVFNKTNEGLKSKNIINFKFDRINSDRVYERLIQAIDNVSFNAKLNDLALQKLYDICLMNKLPFTINGNLMIDSNLDYVLKFNNAKSYLKKDFSMHSPYTKHEIEEDRLYLNMYFYDIGFTESKYVWVWKTSNYSKFISKLDDIANFISILEPEKESNSPVRTKK